MNGFASNWRKNMGDVVNAVTDNPVSRAIASASSAGRDALLSDWRLIGDGKPSQPAAPVAATRQRLDTAIANMLNPMAAAAQAPRPAVNQQPVRTVTSPGFVRQTPAERAAQAATQQVLANRQQAALDNAFAQADLGVPAGPTGQGFNALNIDLDAIQNKANALTTTYNNEQAAAAAAAAAEAERLRLEAEEAERLRLLALNQNQVNQNQVNQNQTGDAVVPVSDTIRSLYGEMSTRDFSDMIRNMMAEREANLRGLNQQSVDQLAANVLRRTGQIGDIKTALETELGVLDADRAGVQQNLVNAVAARAQELQADTEASLAAARKGLGDQVTDEFEKVAQIVGSQAASQAMSSQDAMARLAQVANMAAAERLAAPAELASEAELALGDQQLAYSQALQQNLSEALAGLDAEEAERVLSEAVRQENFNINRDQRMIEALVGDLVRQDTQAFQAGQAQLGRDFSAEQAQLGRDFSADQAVLSRAFSANQSALSRAFQTSERVASQNFKAEQAEIARAAEEDASKIKQEAVKLAAEAEAADEQTAADLYKVDVAIWRQMTGSERQALREDWIETQRLAGVGSEAFPMGTMQNLEQKYPKLDPEFFVHVNAMLGIDTLNADNPEEAENLREKYLETLRITDDYGAKGLTAAETSIIDTLYAELAGDVAAVALQNRNLANDARNMQQRERTGALTR